MKKRKPPFALVGVLVLLVGAAFVMSGQMFKQMNYDPQAEYQALMAEQQAKEKMKAESTSELAKAASLNKPGLQAAIKPTAAGATGQRTGPPVSMVLMPQTTYSRKPVPNDTTIRSLRFSNK